MIAEENYNPISFFKMYASIFNKNIGKLNPAQYNIHSH